MKDWVEYLHDMLKANKLDVLSDKGKISHKKMEQAVKVELEKYINRKSLQ